MRFWRGAETLRGSPPSNAHLVLSLSEPATRVCRSRPHGAKTDEGRCAMICTACGKVNIDGSAFCEQCGARMNAQPAAIPGTAAPGPAPAAFTPPAAPQVAPMASALIASMSMGEKISGGGAIAAAISFFLPWVSIAVLGISASGLRPGQDRRSHVLSSFCSPSPQAPSATFPAKRRLRGN